MIYMYTYSGSSSELRYVLAQCMRMTDRLCDLEKGPEGRLEALFLVYPRVIIRSVVPCAARWRRTYLDALSPSGSTQGPSREACACDTLTGVKKSMNVSRCTRLELFVPGFIIIIVLADTEARRL